MINFIKKYKQAYNLKKGLKLFEQTGQTSEAAYLLMRQMFVATGGDSNDRISASISNKIGKYNGIVNEGILGKLSESELDTMVSEMKENGFYIFGKKLPESLTNEIYNYALKIDKDMMLKFGKNMHWNNISYSKFYINEINNKRWH